MQSAYYIFILIFSFTLLVSAYYIEVTETRQTVDTLDGVDAVYRPGSVAADASDSTYKCAAFQREKTFVSVFPVTLIGLILWAISFLTTDFSGITCPDCQYPRYGISKLIYDSYTLPFKLITGFLTNVFSEVIINPDASGKETLLYP